MKYVIIQLEQRAADGCTHRMVNETTGITVSWGVMQAIGPLNPPSMGAHHVRYVARRADPLPPAVPRAITSITTVEHVTDWPTHVAGVFPGLGAQTLKKKSRVKKWLGR